LAQAFWEKLERPVMGSHFAVHLFLYCGLIAGVPCYASVTDGNVFRAGSAAVKITPKPGVLLDGTIMQIGPVKGIHDDLYVRTLVLDDGTTRIAMAICDACMLGQDVCDKAKAIVHKNTGLPLDRMLCAATHSHCAPRAAHIGTRPLDDEYHDILAQRIADSVIRANKNLAPAKIGWGAVDKPEYPRCRRWLMKPGTAGANPFGEILDRVKMTNAGNKNAIRPVGPVDPELFILSVQHADGRPLALLGNYSIHYVAFKRGEVSADYFGYFARRIEELLQPTNRRPSFVGIMCNGTSGDTNLGSSHGDPFARMKKVGHDLAEEAQRLCQKIPYHNGVSLAMIQADVELAVRRPNQERMLWANATWSEAKRKIAAGQRLTRSEVYARETIHLSRFPSSVSLPIQAIRIGDLAMVAIPCEVFAETGLTIKRSSPFPSTFTISLANGYTGYLPPAEQHKLGGYTTWPARSSYLEMRAESKIRKAVIALLKQLSEKRRGGSL
jgi:hypothetical protein